MQAVADMKPSQTSWRRELSMKEFTHLAQIVQGLTGIRLPEQKRIMMEARLQKRLRRLGLDSFAAYLTFLESGEEGEQEIVELVNAMTTNKTDFFREADHFEVLYNRILPAVDIRRRQDRP